MAKATKKKEGLGLIGLHEGKMTSIPKKTDELFASMEEKFGKGVVVRASDKRHDEVKEWVSTGSLTLDMATGGSGIPKGGRCTAILGKEGAGKTSLALHIMAEDQKRGNLCAFLDAEHSLDLGYAEAIGVDLNMLYLIDRECLLKSLGVKDRDIVSGEEWLEFLCKILKSNLYGTVIFDSVACLIPMAEIMQGIQGGRLAGVASMMAKAYRAVNAALTVSKSAFIYLNQYRLNPGNVYQPLVEPGGEAWKYLQSLKIEISKKVDKDDDGAYGIIVKGKITKSKVCDPFKTFEYYLKFGVGIVREKEILDLAVDNGIVVKGNVGHYTYGEDRIGHGEDKVIKLLQDNPELCSEIEEKILEAIKTE